MRLIELFEAIVYPKLDYLDNVKWDDERYKDIFTRPGYKTDSKNERVLIEFSTEKNDSYDNIQNALTKALEAQFSKKKVKLIFKFRDYINGEFAYEWFNDHPKAPKHEWKTKTDQKIVAFLTDKKRGNLKLEESDDIIKKFVNDPIRHPSNNQERRDDKYLAIISRNPNDIERMTQGRDWEFESCMNLREEQPPSEEDAAYDLWGGWGYSDDDDVAYWLWPDNYGEPYNDEVMEHYDWDDYPPHYSELYNAADIDEIKEYHPEFHKWSAHTGEPLDGNGDVIDEDDMYAYVYAETESYMDDYAQDKKEEYARERIDDERKRYEQEMVENHIDYWEGDGDGESMGFQYIPLDIEYGTLIAYCTSLSDINIEKPIGRVLIKPFISAQKKDLVYFGIERKIYGKDIVNFVETVTEWVDKVNAMNELTEVIGAKVNPDLYYDGMHDSRRVLFPKEFKEDDKQYFEKIGHNPSLIDELQHEVSPENKEKLQILAVKTNWSVLKLVDKPSDLVVYATIQDKNKMPVIVSNLLDEHWFKPSEKIQLLIAKDFPKYLINPDTKGKFSAKVRKRYNEFVINKWNEIKTVDDKQYIVNQLIYQFPTIPEKVQWEIIKSYLDLMIGVDADPRLKNKFTHRVKNSIKKILIDKLNQKIASIKIPNDLRVNEINDLSVDELLVFHTLDDETSSRNHKLNNIQSIRPEYRELAEIFMVDKDIYNIYYMDEPSEKIQQYVIDQNPSLIFYNSSRFSDQMIKYGSDVFKQKIRTLPVDELKEFISKDDFIFSHVPTDYQKFIIDERPDLFHPSSDSQNKLDLSNFNIETLDYIKQCMDSN